MSRAEQELREKIAHLEEELRVRPKIEVPVLSMQDFNRLTHALDKFNHARDLLAQAQQCLVIEFHILSEKLEKLESVDD